MVRHERRDITGPESGTLRAAVRKLGEFFINSKDDWGIAPGETVYVLHSDGHEVIPPDQALTNEEWARALSHPASLGEPLESS